MVIQPVKGLDLELGFTACMRINLEYFAFNYLLDSPTFGLSLAQYTLHSALVRLMKTSYEVNLPEYTSFSSWFSVCIVVDNSTQSLRLKFNENYTSVGIAETNVSKVAPDLRVGYFTGKVADVNMWNWPLTGEQLSEFRHACNNNNTLVKRLVPNLINWQNLTILKLGQATKRATIKESDICKYSMFIKAFIQIRYIFYIYT